MEYVKMGLFTAGYFIVVISFLPLVRLDNWYFRVFEYPRIQKLCVSMLLLFTFNMLYTSTGVADKLFQAALLVNSGYLLYQVYPFTLFSGKQLQKATTTDQPNRIRLFIGNVYQPNRNAAEYIKCIRSANPDVILLVETDAWWQNKADEFTQTHPYQLKEPLENTYGMLLYSKFELVEGKIKYLVEDDIPSVHTCIKLPSGKLIRMYGLHPTPPVPGENPRSTERDKEILIVAKAVKRHTVPVIVAGDLNDVAWSYTTALFSKISSLLDPRRGRGFFNTFHARYPFLRFPLDHVFCSSDFKLVSIRRMNNCGSDHFPIFIELQYEQHASAEQEKPQADADDWETANEKTSKAT